MNDNFLKRFITICGILLVLCVLVILMNIAVPIVTNFVSFVLKLFAPFIAGFIFAYLLVNLVDYLENKGLKRILAVVIVFIGFIAVLVYAVVSLIPIMINQVGDFVNMAPELLQKIDQMLANLYHRFDFLPEKYRFTLGDIGNFILDNVSFTPSIKLSSIFNVFSIIFLTPVATFYFLLEYHNIETKIKKYLKRRNFKLLYRYLHDLDEGMGSYLKGLLLVVNILFLIASGIFLLLGLDYPLLFGLAVGYMDIIPYIGPYLGGAPAVLYAFTMSPQKGIIVLILLVGLQALESNVITPYIQGKTTNIAPLYILLAMTIFGKLFGILGMIMAIPLLFFIIISIRYLRIYLRLRKSKILLKSQEALK